MTPSMIRAQSRDGHNDCSHTAYAERGYLINLKTIIRQKIMRIVMLSLIFVSNSCFAGAYGYYQGGLPATGGTLAKGTSVPICNQPDAYPAKTWNVTPYRWNTEKGEWRQAGPTVAPNTNGATTGQAWNDESTIDPKMILENRVCKTEGDKLFGVPIDSALNIELFKPDDPVLVGDTCLVYDGDQSGIDREALADRSCSISPGIPELYCHVVPSELKWDLGTLTADELAKKSIDLYLSTECKNPHQNSVQVNIEVTPNEVNNVEMAFTTLTEKSLDGDYTLTPGRRFSIKITFIGMPSETGSMTFTSIMKITYL